MYKHFIYSKHLQEQKHQHTSLYIFYSVGFFCLFCFVLLRQQKKKERIIINQSYCILQHAVYTAHTRNEK